MRMRGMCCGLLICLLLFGWTPAQAAELSLQGQYVYDDMEKPDVAVDRAFLTARQQLLEQARVVVSENVQAKGIQVSKDELNVLTLGAMNFRITDQTSVPVPFVADPDKKTVPRVMVMVTVTAMATVAKSPDTDMVERIKKYNLLDNYRVWVRNYRLTVRHQNEVKLRLDQCKDKKERAQLIKAIKSNERHLRALLLFENGTVALLRGEMDDAADAMTQAATLDHSYLDTGSVMQLLATRPGGVADILNLDNGDA